GQGVLIQRIPQPTTATGRSVPAWHAVAFLLIEAIPLYAAFNPPLVEVGIGVFDIKARPRLIRRALTPRNPVFEGQVRGVCDAILALQPRADATTATARNGSRAAQVRLLFEDNDLGSGLMRLQPRGDTDRSRPDNHDICPPRRAFWHVLPPSSRR